VTRQEAEKRLLEQALLFDDILRFYYDKEKAGLEFRVNIACRRALITKMIEKVERVFSCK